MSETKTTSGAVRGFVDEGANVFLGIPYAAPPIGEHRFGAPALHEGWDGVRDCLAYGPTAPQRDPGITIIPEPVEDGDDFLNLNITTPDVGDAKLPVFVWIHGGGFVSGCNRSPWYRGTRFARDGVVLVTIGYRLGVEGFLDIEGAPANRALLDWLAALQWVQENIAWFGGDPSNVTIGGQSAGSAACLTLMVNPGAEGLFRRVIAMSGTSDSRMPRESAKQLARDVAKHLGTEPTRDALARFSPQDLVAAHGTVAANPFDAQSLMKGFDPKAPALRPFADGDVIPEHPFRAIGAGKGQDIAVLAGSTTEELNGAVKMQRANLKDRAAQALEAMTVTGDKLDAYKQALGTDDLVDILAQVATDRAFRAPLAQLLEDRASTGATTYAYQFAYRGKAFDGFAGAAHCLDIPFAFDNLDAERVADGLIGEGAPQHLADEMHRDWVSFVRDGSVSWPAYAPDDRAINVFGDATRRDSTVLDLPRLLAAR